MTAERADEGGESGAGGADGAGERGAGEVDGGAAANGADGDAADEPTVPVVCEECDTRTRVPLSELAGLIERHNDSRHGGREVAGVEPGLADRIADLVAEDMGLLDGE